MILEGFRILPLSEEVSKRAGKVRAEFGVDLIDAIIAATALVNKIPLSTLNRKHFEGVFGLALYEEVAH